MHCDEVPHCRAQHIAQVCSSLLTFDTQQGSEVSWRTIKIEIKNENKNEDKNRQYTNRFE